MIKKNIKKRFSKDYTNVAALSDAVEQAKRELVWEIMKGIAPNTDYIFRLDTYTSTDPFVDEIVFEAQCKAEEAYYPNPFRYTTVHKQTYLPWPRDVIFNAPATIVFWDDGSKTVVKLMDGEEFNPEVGLAMCFCKKVMGDGYKRWFRDGMKKGRWQNETVQSND